MTGKILVVDDVEANVRLLEAKLNNEYYDVYTARSGQEAIEKAKECKPDLILLDVMMPGMDGYETCQIIKRDSDISHIPIVMVTALSEVKDRVSGLAAGADDFLTKPVNDLSLFARVRSLVRLKSMMDELRLRNKTGVQLGLLDGKSEDLGDVLDNANILLIDDDVVESKQLLSFLKKDTNTITIIDDAENVSGLISAEGFEVDLIIVSTQLMDADGLRLCAYIRSQDATRTIPILMLVDEDDLSTVVKGLDIGVNDYITTPMDKNELFARVNTQMKHKMYEDSLRFDYQESVNMAVRDGLTGLYNRHYFDIHKDAMLDQAQTLNKSISFMMVDIDHFKGVNDTYGHQAGDEILREVAGRVAKCLRSADMVARYGGEEFVVITNANPPELAIDIAERIRSCIERDLIKYTDNNGQSGEHQITVSVGVSSVILGNPETSEEILSRADAALYEAKESGRNKVCIK